MAIDPQNDAAILQREKRVWDRLAQGHLGIQIAADEGVSKQVISAIKKRVERRIAKEILGNVVQLRARQVGELRRARELAWKGYEDSCKPAAKRKTKSVPTGTTSTTQMVEDEVKGQSGNPAMLAMVYRGIEIEAKLTGTEAPTKVAQTNPDGSEAYQPGALAAAHARVDELLRLALDRMQAAPLQVGSGQTSDAEAASQEQEKSA